MTERATRDPLAVQVVRLANRLHTTFRAWERDDLSDSITAEAKQWDQQQLIVVACGDIKRGKSSLLNALLDAPQLLPVDADVATSVNLIIRHGDAFSIDVTRLDENGATVVETISADELVEVASMQGDPTRREGVTMVVVTLDHPLLARGITLMDTPGVGGMTRGHRDLALAGLGQADALLFTVSAEEPISRTELEFLAEASERSEQVLLVVTKSDANADEVNEAMMREHRAKLAVFAESVTTGTVSSDIDAGRSRDVSQRMARLQHAPMVLTSSFLADQAKRRAEAGREEQAQHLFERSGITELRTLLENSADKRDLIRVANLLALLRILLTDADRELKDRMRALEGQSGVADEIAERQRALEEFGSKQARWRSTLGNTIIRIQTNASRLVTHELNRVKDHYRDVIDNSDDGDSLAATMPGDLERSLHGAWNELVHAINAEFQTKLGAVLEDFGATGMEAVLGEFEMPEALRQLSGTKASSALGGRSLLEDGLPIALQTFTFASIANAAAVGLGVAAGGLGLLAFGVGAAIAYPVGALRKKAKDKQRIKADMHRYLADLLFGSEGVAREFTTELSLRILDLREEVEAFVEQRLVERRKQLEREQRELQALMKAETGRRAELMQLTTARISDVAKVRAEIEPLQKAVDQRLLS